MFSFLFASLGSLVFWFLFFTIGFFAGTIMLKKIARNSYDFITGKRKSTCSSWSMDGCMWFELIFLLIIVYLFWPIIALLLIIGLIFKYLIWTSFKKGVQFVDKVTPSISFKQE